ncbi:MAG: PhoH family protein [Spirochaetales bacterium]|nr:PhoH family protein [Spirochaetales bacterium]
MKTFVIDTNVFIHKPDAALSFKDNEIVVPLWVLEELDKLKTFSDEKGRSARQAIRFLDEVTKQGDISQGIKLDNGSVLSVSLAHAKADSLDLSLERVDNKILLCAVALQKEGRQVFFVSKDINARVKATALGIRAVDYEKQKVNYQDLYPGVKDIESSVEKITELKARGVLDWDLPAIANEFLWLKNPKLNDFAIGMYQSAAKQLEFVETSILPVCGISPLNEKQAMAFRLLMDPSVQIVTLVGKAGTGKTLLAMAAGLYHVLESHEYTKVLVSRPVIPMGKDIGYLPGAKNEKLSHWMQPLFDNLDYILSNYKKPNIKNVEALMTHNLIEVEALTYIRGRSLPHQFIVIDEAQNLSPHEIKTIVSRAGQDTKIVLTGDPQQIDSPYLDANSNGLTYLVEAFKGQEVYGHVLLDRSERSLLAELAAELL